MANQWRLLNNDRADAADLVAIPSAVVEGRIAGRHALASSPTPDTLIVQQLRTRAIVAGPEVTVDREEAAKRGIDIAVQPRAGRGSARPVGTVPLRDVMAGAKDTCEPVKRGEDDLAALIYTSGTTGEPKGVMITHGNMIAECALTLEVLDTAPDDRFVSLVPFFHIFGLAAGCMVALYRGLATVLVPQYSPRTFIDTLEKAGPTVVIAIPMQYSHLVMAARRRDVHPKRPLKYCISGAAALPPRLAGEFKDRFGGEMLEGYGMTETTAAATLNPAGAAKPGSIGKACPGVAVRVVAQEGREAATGEQGELMVRGPTVCKGYFGKPGDTRELFDNDGFMHTGDLGHRDDEGYLFITDRLKDIVIKGGYNIAPREVEDALCMHPEVAEAAVVGLRGRDLRETLQAYCVLVEGSSVGPAALLAHCRTSLAAYKVPDAVHVVDTLPRSLTGKVLRRVLREQIAEGKREGVV